MAARRAAVRPALDVWEGAWKQPARGIEPEPFSASAATADLPSSPPPALANRKGGELAGCLNFKLTQPQLAPALVFSRRMTLRLSVCRSTAKQLTKHLMRANSVVEPFAALSKPLVAAAHLFAVISLGGGDALATMLMDGHFAEVSDTLLPRLGDTDTPIAAIDSDIAQNGAAPRTELARLLDREALRLAEDDRATVDGALVLPWRETSSDFAMIPLADGGDESSDAAPFVANWASALQPTDYFYILLAVLAVSGASSPAAIVLLKRSRRRAFVRRAARHRAASMAANRRSGS